MAKLTNNGPIHLLVIPFPGQGHLLPLIDLIDLLATRFDVASTIVTTPSNLSLFSPLFSHHSIVSPLVLPFPSHPSIPPNHENTKDLPPQLFNTLIYTLSGLHAPIVEWWSLQPLPPTAILSDMFCGWSYTLAQQLGVPRIVFSPSNALSIASVNDLWRRMPQKLDAELVHCPSLPNSPSFHWYELSGLYRSYKDGDAMSETLKQWFLDNIKSWGYVFNTCYELERVYLDHLTEDLGHGRLWAVGPLALPTNKVAMRGGTSEVDKVMGWLDCCEDDSVVYVAFGTHVVVTRDMATVVAAALEKSGARFIWPIRDVAVLPDGFVDRMDKRGLVIAGWAPQVAILNHNAVAAFVSHGGWNSTLEAVAAGVVLLIWPFGADQFYNARLIVDELGLGFRVRYGGPNDPMPDPNEMAHVIAKAIGQSGEEVQAKAVKMSEKVRRAVLEDGSSSKSLEAFVNELSGLTNV